MIPIQGTAAVLTAPSSPLQTSGYVPGNTLAAQTFNWYLYHMTAEINNVLSGQNLSQSTADDSQLLKAVGRTNILISTSGTVTTATQFAGNTLTQFANLTGSSNYVITAGAARPGVELIIEALTGSGVMIVNGSGSAFLGSGAIRLLWDGSAWCKIGGVAFTRVFTSGSGIAWVTPWKGSFKATVTGGGGAGGGSTGAGSVGVPGTGASTAMSVLMEAAGSVLAITIGSGGSAASGGAGSSGTDSVLSDGTSVLTGKGGIGGSASVAFSQGLSGPSATGGQLNVNGGDSGPGIDFSSSLGWSGQGGGSIYGPGGRGAVATSGGVNGGSASVPGAGGGGGINVTSATTTGGNGASGIVVLEF